LTFESIWESKNIEIDIDIAEEVFVSSDKEMLSIVWNNLLSNAFKFTDDGGKVSISLKNADGFAEVKISDTGCGMSEYVGKHMFDKFYQGDTSRAMQGNGLGLSLVKRIVDIADSSILVESKLNEGTTFTVKLRSE
jgi:signal transduction histidine kinase